MPGILAAPWYDNVAPARETEDAQSPENLAPEVGGAAGPTPIAGRPAPGAGSAAPGGSGELAGFAKPRARG